MQYKDTTEYKKCNALYKRAKNIFGDVVISAYAEKQSVIYNNGKPDFGDIEDTIEFDAISVVLEFKNGNKVKFKSSEWGHMCTFNGIID